MVVRRARERTRRFVRCLFLRSGIAPGSAADSVCGFCTLAAALAVTSGHDGAPRLPPRPPPRSTARDKHRQAAPAATDNRHSPPCPAQLRLATPPPGHPP